MPFPITDSLLQQRIARDGFAIVPGILQPEQIERLIIALDSLSESEAIRTRGGVFAVRNLLDESQAVKKFSAGPEVRGLVEPILGREAFVVRGILFDKTPNANWKVPWHQDQTIAVAERREMEGFGPWSIKAGVQHVQPPASILENMMSVRIHLDDCGVENGALRVIAGSHLFGRISERQASEIGEDGSATECTVSAGDALLMRPLLVHASSAASKPGHRRVIHLDFGACKLPNGLCWLAEAKPDQERVSSFQASQRPFHM